MSEVLKSEAHVSAPHSHIGATWFIKRAIMAVLILFVSIGGGAWLLHASIEPTLDANAAELSVSQQALGPTGSISAP